MAGKFFSQTKDLIKKIISKISRANSIVDDYKHYGMIISMPANAFINMASSMYSMGRIQEAEELLKSAVEFPTNSSDALINLGILKQSKGEFRQAIKYYYNAYKKDKHNIKALVLWGNCLAVVGKFDYAVKKYTHALKINPQESEAYLCWGALLIKRNEHALAKEKLESALLYNPKDIRPLYMLSIVDIEQANYEPALEKLFEVITYTDNNYEALHNIAYVYFKLKDYDQSISYAKKSLAIYRHKIETYLLLGDIYALKDKEQESLNFYQMAEMNGLRTYYLYLSWATSLQKFKHYSEAIEKLEKANSFVKNKDNAEVYVRFAISYYETNDIEKAQENIEKALELSPDYVIANLIAAQIEITHKNYNKALELLDKYDKDYELKSKIYTLKAICYHELSEHQKSKEMFEKAFEYTDNKEETALEYLKFLIEQKDYETAKTKFKQIIETTKNEQLLKTYFTAIYNLAKQNSYKYNVEKAKEVLNRIESLGYEHDFGQEKSELERLSKDNE